AQRSLCGRPEIPIIRQLEDPVRRLHQTRNVMKVKSAIAAVVSTLLVTAASARAADAPQVELTWMSIASWYIKVGDLDIVLDGYISRVPSPPFFYAPKSYPKDQYAYTKAGAPVDVAAITNVRDAMLGAARLDYVLTGHSHFDHSWDSPTW